MLETKMELEGILNEEKNRRKYDQKDNKKSKLIKKVYTNKKNRKIRIILTTKKS